MPSPESKAQSVWSVDPLHPEDRVLASVADVVRRGGVVVYPTETFYGLGGDPLDAAVVERIYRIKGRGFEKPISLIASDREAVMRAVADWPPTAERLAGAFWPGPLTLVLPVRPELPQLLHAGTSTIAVRVSPHPIARGLAAALGGLLTATSANFAGEEPFSNPSLIPPEFLARTDGILHAGVLPGELPSTIVDLTTLSPRLIRAGRISWEHLQKMGLALS